MAHVKIERRRPRLQNGNERWRTCQSGREPHSISEAPERSAKRQKQGVLLDEIPAAYNNIDEVMDHARDLVEVKYVLKQFVNVKGD
jgi:RNA-splicing ligase RtcB